MARTLQRALAFATVIAATMGAAAPAVSALPPFEPEAREVRRCVIHADLLHGGKDPLPSSLWAAIATGLADTRLHRVGLGGSVWIEGFGEVIAVNPDLRLRPASNQKLLTAAGALTFLGPEARLTTAVAAAGAQAGGVLEGDLYLIGGGDPTLRVDGDHSLAALAASVAERGITRVAGDVIVDESRYDERRRANGWGDIVSPTWMGSLSALMVNENRYRIEADFLRDPTSVNAQLFHDALENAGVELDGGASTGSAPADVTIVTTLASPTVAELVRVMLTDSNNTVAEMLVKEVGYRARGIGSTAAGLDAMATILDDFCLPPTILQLDGSGISHGNARSARDWRRLFMSLQAESWYDSFVDGLAVAGETGTLRNRFRGTAASGNLRAKTGTITGIRSLTGTLTTAGGRRVFFSFIVDDDDPRPPMAAIDDLLVAIAEDPS